MRFLKASSLSTNAKMALHSATDPSKIISLRGQAAQFTRGKLHLSDLDPKSPIPQFHKWFSQAQHIVDHPEACTLSTAELPSGRVSSRVVYLKELDSSGGYVVYTNLGTSRKAADLRTNPHAALLFFWEPLQRQVRVEGVVTRMTPQESQAYFDTRVRGSRIGAWASRQSQVLTPRRGASPAAGTASPGDAAAEEEDDGRAQLEEWVKDVQSRFEGKEEIPVPEFWGGLRIVPTKVEFWQGRENRLHDRFLYEREEGEEKWTIQRLSP